MKLQKRLIALEKSIWWLMLCISEEDWTNQLVPDCFFEIQKKKKICGELLRDRKQPLGYSDGRRYLENLGYEILPSLEMDLVA